MYQHLPVFVYWDLALLCGTRSHPLHIFPHIALEFLPVTCVDTFYDLESSPSMRRHQQTYLFVSISYVPAVGTETSFEFYD